MPISLQEIQELVDQGEYQQALEGHIEFHHQTNPFNMGGRVSFALRQWVELGDRYPPARQALIDLRDKNERQCREGGFSDERLFDDVIAISEYLSQRSRSLSFFEELVDFDLSIAERYWPTMKKAVINEERYDLLNQFGFDFEAELEFLERTFDSKKKLYSDPEIGETVKQSSEDYLAERALQLIAVALKMNQPETARQIRDKTLDMVTLDSPTRKLKAIHILEF